MFVADTIDRLPPQNIECEETILGGILLDPEAITRICDRLPAEAFYVGAHKDIYQGMLRLHKTGKPTDMISVANWLSDNDLLARIGGRSKLAQLVDRTVSAVNIDALAEVVIEKHLRRQLIKIGNDIVKLGYAQEIPFEEVLDESQQKVFNLAQSSVDDRPELIHASDAMISLMHKLEEKQAGTFQSIKTGFYDFDAMTGGFEPGQLILVGGRPAMGKSAFALNMSWDIAYKQQKPVFFFSLEMTKEQNAQRLAAALAHVDLPKFKSGQLIEKDWKAFFEAYQAVDASKLYFCDRFDIDMNNIKASMRRAIARTGEKPGLVVIDHISLLAGTEEGSPDERIKMKKTTRTLKQLAGASEFDCPVVALSQLSRGVESRQNKRPMMSDLRESGSLEEDADFVAMMYRDEYYNPSTPDRGLAEVLLCKGRDSETGTVKLLFDGAYSEFKNLAR
jgi:replicative DNA helicase